MKLRTEIESPNYDFQLNYWDRIFTIGSCFAENISEYLRNRKINILSNPFGVLYNPLSIENAFKVLLGKLKVEEDDYLFDQYEWHSFYHHSDFSSHNKDLLKSKIKETNKTAIQFLTSTNLLIITLGTAFVYKYLETEKVVSNCHKIPQKDFEKIRLTTEEAIKSIRSTCTLLKELNSDLKIIFTISPVRHWKDGAAENQRSKSILTMAVDEIIKTTKDTYYFPSYEIMMDDLRDYRFYKKDLLHPNEIAVEYIAEKFINSIMNEESIKFMNDAIQITNSKEHKVRNKESEAYKIFLSNIISKIENLKGKYPKSNFENDLLYFKEEFKSVF